MSVYIISASIFFSKLSLIPPLDISCNPPSVGSSVCGYDVSSDDHTPADATDSVSTSASSSAAAATSNYAATGKAARIWANLSCHRSWRLCLNLSPANAMCFLFVNLQDGLKTTDLPKIVGCNSWIKTWILDSKVQLFSV